MAETDAGVPVTRLFDERQGRLLDAVDVALVLTDLETRVLFMNRAARELHGLPEGDLNHLAAQYGSGFHMLDGQGCPVATEATPMVRAACGEDVANEVYMIQPTDDDFVRLWEYSARSIGISDDAASHVILTIRDVTVDLCGEQGAHSPARTNDPSPAERLQTFLELLPVGAAICDDQGTMVETNTALDEIWGGHITADSVDELGIYRAWWAETGTPLRPQDWGMYRAVMFGQTSSSELLDIERPNGRRSTILSSAAPVRNERGTITGAVAVMQDVTERMRAERLGWKILQAVGEIIGTTDRGDRVSKTAEHLTHLLNGSTTAYVSVGGSGQLELRTGREADFGSVLTRHAADLWDAMRTLRATPIPAGGVANTPALRLVPVSPAVAPPGCFITLMPAGATTTDAEMSAAEELVRLVSPQLGAAVDRGWSTRLSERPGELPMQLAVEDPEEEGDIGTVASAILGTLMSQVDADYGRVVVAAQDDFEREVSLLSEAGSSRDEGDVDSMGVSAALVTREQIVRASEDGPADDTIHFSAYVTSPFTTDSGGGCVTLAWEGVPGSLEARAELVRPSVRYLGYRVNSAQLRQRLAQAMNERSFVSAVATAAASCFDAAGIQEAVARVFSRHLGAKETRLFRLDAAECIREIVPTFAPVPSAECLWAEIETALTEIEAGALVVTADDGALGRLVSPAHGRHSVVVPLQLRGRAIGLVATSFDSDVEVDPNVLALLKAAAREVADALAVAEYCAAQARIAMRSRVAEAMESKLRDMPEETEVVEFAVSTAIDALKADGVAYLARDGDRWEIKHRAGVMEAEKIVRLAGSAVEDVSYAATMLFAHGTALVSTARVDDQLFGLVALRDQSRGPFVQEDLELLYRIHATTSHTLRSIRLSGERESILTAREQWLADVSHDLKTPLSAVRAYAELLASPGHTPAEETRRQAARIVRQASEIERLLGDLQLVFRIRAQALPVERNSHDANDIASEVVQLTRHDARAHDRKIELATSASPVPLEVDRRLLVRALSNVTMNAVVHAGPAANVVVRVSTSENGGRIEVSDDGKGIDPREIERVFERYYRGYAARGDGVGSGLGLPIARELVELMGGTLTAHSEPGIGTTIAVDFPNGNGRDTKVSRPSGERC